MSSDYVTADGLLKPTLAELKAQIEEEYKERFGSDIDLDPDSVFGQFVGVTAQGAANWWDAVEEIYNSRDPEKATGQQLDAIAAETGTTRLEATPTRIEDVILYGSEGTIVVAGKQARRTDGFDADPTNPELFSLESDVEITEDAARSAKLAPGVLGSALLYQVIVTGATIPETVLWMEDFVGTAGLKPAGWFDNTDDPSFDCTIVYDATPSLALLTVVDVAGWGKVVSFSQNVDLDVYNKVEVVISELDPSASMRVGIFHPGPVPPYQFFDLLGSGPSIFLPGTYVFDIPSITGETGVQFYGIQLALEGPNGIQAKVDSVRIFGYDDVSGIDVTLSYLSDPSDDADDIVNGLIASCPLGYRSLFDNDEGELSIYSLSDFQLSYGTVLDLTLLGSAGVFVADNNGPIPVPSNSLTVIVTPVSGWDSVNNPEAGDTGEPAESDEALRLRRIQNLIQGSGTEAAIEAALQRVDGVDYAAVTSNRTNATDADGRPPKSFEAVVSGGSSTDIAQAIWDNQPAGIESYGTESETVTDSQGNPQVVEFSRPEALYVFVQVLRDYNSEESYPAGGDALIKQAIVDWAEENLSIGDDVIRQRLSIPVYTISGIGDIEITLDYSTDPLYVPAYSAQNVTVTSRQLATFEVANIVVGDLP